MVKKRLTGVIAAAGIGLTAPTSAHCAGLWREQHPVWNTERCFQCGMCWLLCPDGAVAPLADGYYDVDADRCKGCGICAAECPNEAISMTPGP